MQAIYTHVFDRYVYKYYFFTIWHLSNACFPLLLLLLFADVVAIAQETFLS